MPPPRAQQHLDFSRPYRPRDPRGGARPGAGRKPIGPRPQIRHASRAPLDARTPVHVTLRVRPDIRYLRRRTIHRRIRETLARIRASAPALAINHYSLQSNHLHLIVESTDALALGRGIGGFASSIARKINRATRRRGRVFADRYHARYLHTPLDVRNALRYVLNIWRRHRVDAGTTWACDPFSSADAFDGWSTGPVPPPSPRDGPAPVSPPRTWLLRVGWRRRGTAISPRDVPRG